MQGFDLSIPGGQLVDTETQAQQWLQYFIAASQKVGALGIDSETTGVVHHKDFVVVWSLSDGTERICLPSQFLPIFKEPLLENPKVNFDFSNCKFDAHMFANTGVDLSKAGEWRDTTTMSWLLNENNLGRHGLKECVVDHFGRKTPTFEEIFGKLPPKKNGVYTLTTGELIRNAFNDPERRMGAADYASLDAYNSTMLRQHFDGLLKKEGLYDLYYNIEVPFSKVLWKMERRGITIDAGFLRELQLPMKKEMDSIQGQFAKEAGRPINLNSTNDIRWFFIEKLGRKPIKLTPGGKTGIKQASTDEDVLTAWADDGDPWAVLLLRFRGYAKIYGTYVMGIQKHLDPYNRIHTTLNQHGTVTGRLSSKEPNLQNIPRTSEDIFKIREAFIAGWLQDLVVADYAQLEMRLMAHFSGDEKMINAIKNGVDLHCLTVSEMHGIPYDEVIGAVKAEKAHKKGKLGRELTEREEELLFLRQCAKATGFGIIYGIGGARLAAELTASAEEAAKKQGKKNARIVTEDEGFALIEKWFKVFPRARAYINETHYVMQKDGFVKTITGRFRRFGDVKFMSFKDKSRAERQGVNSIIQGSAADIAKVVMLMAEEDTVLRDLGAKLLLQVHDELIWECPKDPEVQEKVKKRVQELMEAPFTSELAVPLPAEVGIANSWAAAK